MPRLKAAKLSGKADDLASSLVSIGLLERGIGISRNAFEKFDEAAHLLLQRLLAAPEKERKQIAHILAVCYINKALLCREAEGSTKLKPLRQAEDQHRISEDKLDAGKALLFRGELHCGNADWQDGFECFGQALKFFEEANNLLWGARALERMSRLFATTNDGRRFAGDVRGADGARQAGHPASRFIFFA